MRYFSISQGLWGCYLPDNGFIVAVETRRELKRYLMNEASAITDAGFVGLNKKAIAWLAAASWRNSESYCVPYRYAEQGASYAYALFCQQATRDEWLDYQDD
jgi:hypothetical protein